MENFAYHPVVVQNHDGATQDFDPDPAKNSYPNFQHVDGKLWINVA